MTLISNEVGKQRRLAPVRELIRRSANSLQKLMPCWMMGPSSVAQFLPPDVVRFDLLVIDEASQIRPEDALGSLARADQVVVVGDSNQMPPSDFFSTNPHDDDDDQACGAEEIGSILERLRDFFAERSLVWHYRSQHQSLILFSNERYYEKKLIVPPSVHRDHPKLGVKWHHLAEARYHAGINEQEAYAVIQLLIEHVRTNIRLPEETRETIGVVAMNVKQQGLIQEMLDRYLAEDAIFAENFSIFEGACPVFVKNLESVQGDERDVIIISFTFGPDLATNRVFQRFGPIMREGGWRRLNVLFTRARRRIHACSSMRYTDITISEERRDNGAADLRAYLEYAEKGLLPDYGETTGKGPDSPFEEAVARVISDLGYDAHYQVGVDGFQIDIGVVHPDSPGSYLCGIECDGAKYHSHPVARDRDRLREEILRARGWEIYRIWSTDWYRNRTTEIERLQKELQRLRSHWRGKVELDAKF